MIFLWQNTTAWVQGRGTEAGKPKRGPGGSWRDCKSAKKEMGAKRVLDDGSGELAELGASPR